MRIASRQWIDFRMSGFFEIRKSSAAPSRAKYMFSKVRASATDSFAESTTSIMSTGNNR